MLHIEVNTFDIVYCVNSCIIGKNIEFEASVVAGTVTIGKEGCSSNNWWTDSSPRIDMRFAM